jgi:hypothetical protein
MLDTSVRIVGLRELLAIAVKVLFATGVYAVMTAPWGILTPEMALPRMGGLVGAVR